jgi:tol-pal system beta propeller repeat protein TolB
MHPTTTTSRSDRRVRRRRRRPPLALALLAGAAATVALRAGAPGDAGPRVTPLVVASPQTAQQPTSLSLALTNAASHPRIGLPDFTGATGDAALGQVAATVANVLWADIDFEKEFYMIDRAASKGVPAADSEQTLPDQQWKDLGADFVMLGSIHREAAGKFAVDVRLVGVQGDVERKVPFSFRYHCDLANPRVCAHFISDDFHKKTRALDGVARTRLAFTSSRDASRFTGRPLKEPGRGKDIYLSDYDGANEQRVTANRSLNGWPAWAPDGRTLAYTTWAPGFIDLVVIDLYGARAASRPANGGPGMQNIFPAWSPDGTRLAFASTRSGNSDIWIVNRDGTGLRDVTNNRRAVDNAPVWSPTGAQLAFTSNRTGTNQIYVINADGTGLTQVTHGTNDCDRPSWSMRNTIAYTSGPSPDHDIFLYDLSTGQTSLVTGGEGNNEAPAFAPNGRHIAFWTTRWGQPEIAIVDVDGKNVRQITRTGANWYPAWSPTPGG